MQRAKRSESCSEIVAAVTARAAHFLTTAGTQPTINYNLSFVIRFLIAFLSVPIVFESGVSCAAAQESTEAYISDYPYALEAPEARRDRLKSEKSRVREYIARAKAGLLSAPSADEIAKQREDHMAEKVLNDSSLQRGDIVSTGKSLYLFRGRTNGNRFPEDFVRLPSRSADPNPSQQKLR